MIDQVPYAGNYEGSEANMLVGKTVAEAKKSLERSGHTLRVVEKDGEFLLCTMEFRINRFNVATQDDVIIRFVSRG
jgi:hypothetical protein